MDTYLKSENGIEIGKWTDVTLPCYEDQRARAKQLCHAFNQALPGSTEQKEILKRLLEKSPFLPDVLSPVYFDYGTNTSFGKGCFVNHGCYFMDGAPIILKDNCFIGPFCGFYTVNHPLQIKWRNEQLEKAEPIVIEKNCWLGANVNILSGVHIGAGCVIAAGSVVTRSFGPDQLIGGVPAKVIRPIDQNAGLDTFEKA